MKNFLVLLLSFVVSSYFVQADNFAQYRISSSVRSQQLRLIQYDTNSLPEWMEQTQIDELARAGIHYMDITDHQDMGTYFSWTKDWQPSIPTKVNYQYETAPFIGNLTTVYMTSLLRQLTQFRTRYYKYTFVERSNQWLMEQVRLIINDSPEADHVSMEEFKHTWKQSSIIARIRGSNIDLSDELVVIGAHQDSINLHRSHPYFRSPGADDDGSGTVTILETFRTLVKNGFRPERTVEFHWYSAEEVGLLGSQDVVGKYLLDERKVVGMLQSDMTGYIGKHGQVIGIVTDNVNAKLTEFLKQLVDQYASIPYVSTQCGFACSDHVSWHKAGFPSAFAIESALEDINPFIHTENDTLDKLSFEHMLEFAKLATGFAVELSHSR